MTFKVYKYDKSSSIEERIKHMGVKKVGIILDNSYSFEQIENKKFVGEDEELINSLKEYKIVPIFVDRLEVRKLDPVLLFPDTDVDNLGIRDIYDNFIKRLNKRVEDIEYPEVDRIYRLTNGNHRIGLNFMVSIG